MSNQYRFLNPYNFVRWLEPKEVDTSDPDIILLGKCMPPPHDRYIGLTGKIDCELTTKTLTFIADSEFVKQYDERDHLEYRFFRLKINGKEEFAIPSTSIRGMLRSVFEAVTSSCFSVFDYEKKLSYRVLPNFVRRNKLIPAIVKSLPSANKMGTVLLCKQIKIKDNANIIDPDIEFGEEVWAIVENNRIKKITRHVDNKSNAIRGWIRKTGRIIENKRHEFFFKSTGKYAKFDINTMNAFNDVLKYQKENGTLEQTVFQEHYKSPNLKVGDLVYVILDKYKKDKVTHIALAQIPRLQYKKSLGQLIPKELLPCDDFNRLCPACRVFGWVKQNVSEKNNEKIAYASRIRITNGILKTKIDESKILKDVPLSILSSPKPTTTFFYLTKNGVPDGFIDYNSQDAKLRGRKFYRHFKPSEKEYIRPGRDPDRRDHQNRTLQEILPPDVTFSFSIYFKNLASVELGALLWTIELEENMYHKIGMGKPFGFGSAKIQIKSVSIIDFSKQYSSLKNASTHLSDKEITDLKELFEKAMAKKYNTQFNELVNICDLRAILSEPPNNLPVHYPRKTKELKEDTKNFEWFVANKRITDKNKRIVLPIASKDNVGLPIKLPTTKKKEKRKKKNKKI